LVSLTTLANHIKRLLDKDWDYIAGVSGDAGVGKSSMVCQLGSKVNKDYNFKHNNIYKQSALNTAIYEYPEKSFINVDEAINVLYRRDFAKGGQKQLLKDFDMIRDRNLCVFFLIPNFWDLDTKILNSGRIKLWIYLDLRGFGLMFKPDKNPFNQDRWNRDLNKKLFTNWETADPKKSPNFVDYLEFKPMDAELYKEYKADKAYKRREASKENEDDEEELDTRTQLVFALTDAGISQGKIARQIHMSSSTICELLKKRREAAENTKGTDSSQV
jgi:predicted XRE-type DNA-binding protein